MGDEKKQVPLSPRKKPTPVIVETKRKFKRVIMKQDSQENNQFSVNADDAVRTVQEKQHLPFQIGDTVCTIERIKMYLRDQKQVQVEVNKIFSVYRIKVGKYILLTDNNKVKY